jgi:GTP cyclohydrolase I
VQTEVEKEAEAGVHALLRFIGENPQREGLQETPQRVLKAYKELCSGYDEDPASVFKTFDGAGYEFPRVESLDSPNWQGYWISLLGVCRFRKSSQQM